MQKVGSALTVDSRDEPLAHFYRAYRHENGLGVTKPVKSESKLSKWEDTAMNKSGKMVTWDQSSIAVGPARFKFNRTLRVPDDAANYALPPVRSVDGNR